MPPSSINNALARRRPTRRPGESVEGSPGGDEASPPPASSAMESSFARDARRRREAPPGDETDATWPCSARATSRNAVAQLPAGADTARTLAVSG